MVLGLEPRRKRGRRRGLDDGGDIRTIAAKNIAIRSVTVAASRLVCKAQLGTAAAGSKQSGENAKRER